MLRGKKKKYSREPVGQNIPTDNLNFYSGVGF